MNLFEKRADATDKLRERAKVFVYLASAAMESLRDEEAESNVVPHFVNSYHGFHAEVYEYDHTRWIDNPNYNPNLTDEEYRLPENHAVDAGFRQIMAVDKVCNIIVVECQDTWDDCAGEPETWTIHSVPQDLFLNGSESDVVAFFTERFEAEVKRDNENAFTNKWSNLFHYYTPEELQRAIDARLKADEEFSGNLGKNFERYLNELRAN